MSVGRDLRSTVSPEVMNSLLLCWDCIMQQVPDRPWIKKPLPVFVNSQARSI